jgi:hypothetical protein
MAVVMSTLLPLARPFSIVGSTSAPATGGVVLASGMPAHTSHVDFLRLSGNSSALVFRHTAAVTVSSGPVALAWNTSLPAGVYLLRALPSLRTCTSQVVVHSGYSLISTVDPLTQYSTAGRQQLVLRGTDVVTSNAVVVRFAGNTDLIELPGTVDAEAGTITTTTPAWRTPTNWCAMPCYHQLHPHSPHWTRAVGRGRTSGCADPTSPVRSATCVPDMSCTVSFSLDGGVTFSNALSISFGYVRKTKVAFLYVGPINDFGWYAHPYEPRTGILQKSEGHTAARLHYRLPGDRTYAINQGRLHVEQGFGGLVDTTTYFESLEEGEFEAEQDNRGATLATKTPVYTVTVSGRRNAYYAAFATMKRLCEEDFDLVFAASFGFMSQTIDVTNYSACYIAADGLTAAPTNCVHLGGMVTNSLLSTTFGSRRFPTNPPLCAGASFTACCLSRNVLQARSIRCAISQAL